MKTFLRLFSKRKSYYLTNILGLTVGLAAVGFSVLYLEHELSYDSFHPGAENLYRVSYQNDAGWFASLHKHYTNALMQDTIPEVEEVARVRRWHSKYVFVGDKKFYESKVMMTDPGTHLFDLFPFPFKEGVSKGALDRPNSVVISSSLAKKYFGDKPAIGEAIHYDTMALTITGVFEDLPTNTVFPFTMLIANEQAMKMAIAHFTFVRLHPDTDIAKLEAKIFSAPVTDRHHTMKEIKVMPMRTLHFDGNLTYEMKPAGSRSYLWIFGAIGAMIMLIAFTNFVNLSIALYARRSREIAVRKSVGASSALLSRQFLLESFMTIGIALALALLAMHLLTPSVNLLLELTLPSPFTSPVFLTTILLLIPAITVLAGVYPSVILPKIHILDLFKRTGMTTNHGVQLRMVLLGFQLIVLFFVCCALWVIYGQFSYIKNKDLGFEKNGVIKIRRAWEVDSSQFHTIKTQLLQHSIIKAVSQGYAPGDEDFGMSYRSDDSDEIKEGVLVQMTDYDYLDVLGIENNISTLPNRSVVINETLAKALGYDDPIGRRIVLDPGTEDEKAHIINGVIRDIHYNSLHHSISPQIFFLRKFSRDVAENILIKVDPANIVEAVALVNKQIDTIIPNIPVEISFLDTDLEKLYKQETTLSRIVIILVSISLILSLVGLVALCSYMIEFRMKEIAIRKVLGAATEGIVLLFAKVFVKTTIISFAIGAPACYFVMAKWTEGFAYRTNISVSLFVYTLLIILFVITALSALQTLKASNINPSKILKE